MHAVVNTLPETDWRAAWQRPAALHLACGCPAHASVAITLVDLYQILDVSSKILPPTVLFDHVESLLRVHSRADAREARTELGRSDDWSRP